MLTQSNEVGNIHVMLHSLAICSKIVGYQYVFAYIVIFNSPVMALLHCANSHRKSKVTIATYVKIRTILWLQNICCKISVLFYKKQKTKFSIQKIIDLFAQCIIGCQNLW